ncbi:MAG: asparagine synthase (glutamine-hydrolyzing) [Acidobacteriota bacterium]
MCGIVGHFARDGGAMAPDTLFELVQCVSHRGPDDSTFWQDGPYSFGHRRLSIIDLSPGGRQPMASADGAIVITFNGEIYNYIELRAELAALGHVFRTQSDTEVLIAGYRQWGIDLLPKLLGMFAFAIADRPKRELLLARDRFGEKPLLYLDESQGTTFASELKPLSRIARHREVDGDALGRYLVLNYVPGDQTLFKGVQRVPPGGWRRYRANGQIDHGIYWSPPVDVDAPGSFEDAVDRLESKLQRAVELTLRSDVPVGIFLSGGIDSSLVARAAVKSGSIARAFSLGFAEQSHSELPGARSTAAKLGLPITEVTLDASALERFTDLVAHADDPLADSSALAVWTLAAETAKHVKVVLAGDGGDELFGGYLTYPATLWHASVTSRLPRAVRRAMAAAAGTLAVGDGKVTTSYKLMRYLRAATLPPGEAHFSWNGTWLPDEAAAIASAPEVKTSARDALRWMARRHDLTKDVSLEQLQRADVRDYLVNDILVKSDRMSMAHGLEVRAPFLDRDLAEFALRLPAAFKAGRRGPGKRILRALARRTYGSGMASATKQGFSIPVHQWLRGPARGLVDDLLSPSSIASIGLLDGTVVARAVADHQSGRRALGWELWGLMVLAAWHRQQIQRVLPVSVSRPEAVVIPFAS